MKFNPSLNVEMNAFNVTFQITQAAKASIGTKRVKPREHPWWNHKMEKLKRKKKSLQRKLTPKLERDKPKRYERLKRRWNNLRHRLNNQLKERKVEWNEKINAILSSPKHTETFWKVVNNPIRKPPEVIPPLKDKKGETHDDIETKLQLLLDTYMSPPQPKQATEMEKGNYRYIERVYQKLLREKPDLENNIDTFLNRDIEVREVRMVIAKPRQK